MHARWGKWRANKIHKIYHIQQLKWPRYYIGVLCCSIQSVSRQTSNLIFCCPFPAEDVFEPCNAKNLIAKIDVNLSEFTQWTLSKMHLMYTIGSDGKRVYTLKKVTDDGEITKSAHPARFSPDDKFSRQRVTLKKRYNLLPTQNQQ